MSGPDALGPFLTRPALPRLVLIADGFTHPDVARRTLEAAEAGVPWIHLRDHAASEDAFAQSARALARQLRSTAGRPLLSVNGRLEVAQALGAGYHAGPHGAPLADARGIPGQSKPVGFSAHTAVEVRGAFRAGADYVFVSPVYQTSSKPGVPPLEAERLRALIDEAAGWPVYALGGITPERAAPCLEAGAYGVVVLSGILGAAAVPGAVQAYLEAVSAAVPALIHHQ